MCFGNVVGARSVSDEISMVEMSRCFDSEDRESQGREKEKEPKEKEKDKDKEKSEKYKEKEDKDEGKYDVRPSAYVVSWWTCLYVTFFRSRPKKIELCRLAVHFRLSWRP